jgi:hypothetical protein
MDESRKFGVLYASKLGQKGEVISEIGHALVQRRCSTLQIYFHVWAGKPQPKSSGAVTDMIFFHPLDQLEPVSLLDRALCLSLKRVLDQSMPPGESPQSVYSHGVKSSRISH